MSSLMLLYCAIPFAVKLVFLQTNRFHLLIRYFDPRFGRGWFRLDIFLGHGNLLFVGWLLGVPLSPISLLGVDFTLLANAWQPKSQTLLLPSYPAAGR